MDAVKGVGYPLVPAVCPALAEPTPPLAKALAEPAPPLAKAWLGLPQSNGSVADGHKENRTDVGVVFPHCSNVVFCGGGRGSLSHTVDCDSGAGGSHSGGSGGGDSRGGGRGMVMQWWVRAGRTPAVQGGGLAPEK